MIKNFIKKYNLFTFIYGIVATIIIIPGILLQIDYINFKEYAEITKAKITDTIVIKHLGLDGRRNRGRFVSEPHILVTFSIDNVEYSGYTPVYDKELKNGDLIDIYYNPQNPNDFIDVKYPGYIKFIHCGIAFLILFVISITFTSYEYNSIPSLKYSMQYNNKKKLKQTGTLIDATITRIYFNTKHKVGVLHPCVLEARATLPNSNKEYVFKSFYNWTNLQPIVKKHAIKTVKVYVDLDNPKKYFMDLEPIKKLIKH